MFKPIVFAVAAALCISPVNAQCTGRSKGNTCNGIAGDADSLNGCAVETSKAWYTIRISEYGRSTIKKICTKNPDRGFCGCPDYGIY